MNKDIIEKARIKAESWLKDGYDIKSQEEVRKMISSDDSMELVESFYKNLEFGTGGLRGIMGVGSNRMNIYTVGSATQGLANYINKCYPDEDNKSVCIGHDCRNKSRMFAETVANIFSANGIKAYLFEDLRPTPEMSYCIRELKCKSGVIITASHNPKEYNGYKAYWADGGQLVPPHDKNVIDEVNKVDVKDIKFEANNDLIEILPLEIDKQYLDAIKTISLSPKSVENQHDLKIVFTPIHGTTYKLVPESLKNWGFTHIYNVAEQDIIDGNFPTVESANPEEPAALSMALDRAKEVDAEIVMACDPDGDRLGIATKNDKSEWILINGNQTAILFTWYILEMNKKACKLQPENYMVKTIVTSELIKDICSEYKVACYDVYTGFKWIADQMSKLNGEDYLGGGEESFGYMPSSFTRDKDGVAACSLMAEIAAWAKDNGKTLYELLKDIYIEFGYSKEKMRYVVKQGLSGAQEIENIMKEFRNNPPKSFAGSDIVVIKDYQTQKEKLVKEKEEKDMHFETKSNVLQFFLEDGTKISVRPSGTEPKIKFYFEIKDKLESYNDFDRLEKQCEDKIESIIQEMNL